MRSIAPNEVLPFIRKKEYLFVRQLNEGGFGITVLLHDDVIGENLVCKKYQPEDDSQRELLFANFIREIKLLHRVFHVNVVRVYNYFVYPEESSGFILMEFVDGFQLREYLAKHPQKAAEVFLQTIDGFAHLESKGVLHRDIRDGNIMVSRDGIVKIIDLGFGKAVEAAADFEKSIVLNWGGDSPFEFKQQIYNFSTEVYFVGVLFREILQDLKINGFKYDDVIQKMCKRDPAERLAKFADVGRESRNAGYTGIKFTEEEKETYQQFATYFTGLVGEVDPGITYRNDISKILVEMDNFHGRHMLEDNITDAGELMRAFFIGRHTYYPKQSLPTWVLADFIELFRNSSFDKQSIILANLQKRFDALPRIRPGYGDDDDEIPF